MLQEWAERWQGRTLTITTGGTAIGLEERFWGLGFSGITLPLLLHLSPHQRHPLSRPIPRRLRRGGRHALHPASVIVFIPFVPPSDTHEDDAPPWYTTATTITSTLYTTAIATVALSFATSVNSDIVIVIVIAISIAILPPPTFLRLLVARYEDGAPYYMPLPLHRSLPSSSLWPSR